MAGNGVKTDTTIRDLAIIGDRRTAAVVARDGSILWYCPERFDRPSLLAGLLDPAAGAWTVQLPEATPGPRRYLGDSGVLETRLCTPAGDLVITDFMPVGRGAPNGLVCRRFSRPPEDAHVVLEPRPDYARREPSPVHAGGVVLIDGSLHLYSSHPLSIDGRAISFNLPKGEEGWAVLSDEALGAPTSADLNQWLSNTLDHWRAATENASYSGPYEREVADSVRAIRLMCHDETGGIIAAATTSLPEVPGGSSNWDYRYVWLRDAGMIVSALTRLGGDVIEARRYLDFICAARGSSSKYPLAVFTNLDGRTAPAEEILDFTGYLGSRPVRIGNNARDQLQLDAFANVLLAAKLIYQHSDERPHWDAVEEIADFLVEHWREPDFGIWEEKSKLQYTSNKVVVACALDSVAEFSTDEAQAAGWRTAVRGIRDFVASHCLTPEGAYAAHAGSEDVDVSAALIPIWGYTAADAPEMLATMAALERDYSWEGLLYWRRLECTDSREEGAFLAGTFWVAQYWVMRGDLDRARRILDAGLAYANDVGLLSEEADPRSDRALGNIPQTFVHAALVGAVIDLKTAASSRS